MFIPLVACAAEPQHVDDASDKANEASDPTPKAGHRWAYLEPIGDIEFDFWDGHTAKVPAWVNVVKEMPARPTEEPLTIDRIVIAERDAARAGELLDLLKKAGRETKADCSFMLGPVFDVEGYENGLEAHRVCGTVDKLALAPEGISCTGEDIGPGEGPGGAHLMFNLDAAANAALKPAFDQQKRVLLVAGDRVVGFPFNAFDKDNPAILEVWAGGEGKTAAAVYQRITGKAVEACQAP